MADLNPIDEIKVKTGLQAYTVEDVLAWEWSVRWADTSRESQRWPVGDWVYWMVMAGRGFGKTRTGAENIAQLAWAEKNSRIAVVAPTAADVRDTCFEGESGLLAVIPPALVETYNRTLQEIVLKNGSRFKGYSAAEPSRLRGPQHHAAWCLPGDTLVTLSDGTLRAISNVREGDLVLTRFGARRVVAAELTQKDAELWDLETADGTLLRGTVNHNVFANGAFKPLGDLTPGCIVLKCKSTSSSKELSSTIAEKTTTATREDGSRTAFCGSFLTAQFLKGLSSIIRTRISSIMSFLTLCSYQGPTTCEHTSRAALSRLTRASGANSPKPSGKKNSQCAGSVSCAAKNTSAQQLTQLGVGRNAVLLQDTVVVRSELSGLRADVYDLTIEDAHEFFANGILVHNCDEIAAWSYPEALDMLMFGLRLGKHPKVILTTTPRPTEFIRNLVKRANTPKFVLTKGNTFDNKANLNQAFLDELKEKYEGTRLGRQELEAEILDDIAGALWNYGMIERLRFPLSSELPDFVRVVVAIDPAATATINSDNTGIIVAAKDRAGIGYVLEDASMKGSPDQWASLAVALSRKWRADRIVAEKNNGGDMVEACIRAVDPRASVRMVSASRGKITRAEPVSALYEQNKVHHVGTFKELEDEMCSYVGDPKQSSPDRMDALVWALTELMLDPKATNPIPRIGPIKVLGANQFGGIGIG